MIEQAQPHSSPSIQVPVDGILLVDKPTGWTSHDVVGWLRRRTGIKRIGHAGTLDPLATGLLIVLVGRAATKLQDTFLKLPKVYECEFQLGLTTDTYDSLGSVTSEADWTAVSVISQPEVEAVLQTFLGQTQQQVPAYSAVKVAGRRLHRLARNGEQLPSELPSRTVTITAIDLLDWQLDPTEKKLTVSIRVACGSGTYIRSLVHDIGQRLGVGATVTALRRISIDHFSVQQPGVLTLPAHQPVVRSS